MRSTLSILLLAAWASATPLGLYKRQGTPLTAYARVSGNGIEGLFNFTQVEEGTMVTLSVTGLSNTSSSYPWHIHTNPITGACSTALGHLDPLEVGDGFACPASRPYLCQEGDLSGKHGKLPGSTEAVNQTFVDNYVRFYPAAFSIFGRSVVIHASNGTTTRLACGNISTTFTEYANYQSDYRSVGPSAPTTTITVYPSGGSATDLSALSAATLPLSLPEVYASSAIGLYTSAISQTVRGSVVESVRPIPTQVPTSAWVYSSGAALPTRRN